MTKELKISINKACLENWNSFDKNGIAGFCERCQKNVIDFTSHSDKEILAFFNQRPNGVCGRFRPAQLKTYQFEKENRGLTKTALIAAGVLTLTQVDKSVAQEIKTETSIESQTFKNNFIERESTTSKVDTLIYTIKGHVYSIDEKSDIPGANVIVKGTQIGAATGICGNFQLTYTGEKKKITLIISYIGFETIEKEIELKDQSQDIGTVNMKLDIVVLGEVCTHRKWSPRWIWHRITGIF